MITCLGLVSCVAPPRNNTEASELEVKNAMEAFFNCQIDSAPKIDDKISDARTIALAVTNYCYREYVVQYEVFGKYNLDNNNQRRMFAQKQNSNELKIEASLHIVLLNRSGNLPSRVP